MTGAALSGKKYKAYPEYKKSGVKWLGEIPSDWNTSKLKRYCQVTDGSHHSPKIEVDGKPFISVTDVGENSINFENSKKISVDNYIRLVSEGCKPEVGDVLLTKDGTIGRACVVQKDMPEFVILSSLGLLTPSKLVSEIYLYYYLISGINIDQMNSLIHGSALRRMTISKIDDLFFCFPKIKEQQKIASFLDHETAKIDTLIAKQEKLIELLKEKRQVVISHAVTKGLNPDAPMRDSGVEWLGEVPEHWEVTKLKWKTPTTSGGTPTTSKYEMYYQDGHIPWIRTTDLNNSKLLETPVNITPKALGDTACSILPKDSVLLAMYGGAGSIGKHSLLMFEASINQAVCGIYPSSAFESEFLHYFYEFYRPFWMINAAGTRKDPNIGQDHIKDGKVVLPPIEEQQTIVAHINKTLTLLDRLKDKAIDAIELAKERKTALISATVTGKIDVRDWEDDDRWNG